MPSFLENPKLRLLLFGGKGGCGKTTSAAATALHLATQRPQARTLVVSTDPAHSLADALDLPLGNEAKRVPGAGRLWAVELDAGGLDEDFRERNVGILKEIAQRGTQLDREDVGSLFSLPMPGLDEVMAVLWIAEALESGRYDLILLDTAPTGHTLRLLAMPGHMQRWNRIFGLMQAKHRYLAVAFAGRHREDRADRFLERMERNLKTVRALLSDTRATEFVPVAIPEPMSILETERLLGSLKGSGVAVRSVIINRVERARPGCGFCLSRGAAQQDCLDRIRQSFAPYERIEAPLFPGEVRGREALSEYAEALTRPHLVPNALPDGGSPPGGRKILGAVKKLLRGGGPRDMSRPHGHLRRLRDNPGPKFLLFGGKGGVGKTSLASAAALHLAKGSPGRKVLVFSADPAHSLSDCFGCRLDDKPTPIPGLDNLEGLETDAAKLYEDFKERHGKLMRAAFDRFLEGGIDAPFERKVSGEFASLIPPGIDEVMALSKVMDLFRLGRYDLYVLDTAPTGHMLRFLELPGLIREWLKVMFRLLIKHRAAARLDELSEELVAMSKSVREMQRLFSSADETDFVAVTIPEAMAVLETERLLSRLAALKFPCRHIVANMVLGPTECSFCSARRNDQEAYMRKIRGWGSSGRFVSTLPLRPRPIGGMETLEETARTLFGAEN